MPEQARHPGVTFTIVLRMVPVVIGTLLVAGGASTSLAQQDDGFSPVRPVKIKELVQDISKTVPPKVIDAGFALPSDDALRVIKVPGEVLELVALMGDRLWSVREAASIELVGLEVPDETLFAVLSRGDLDPEQRARLLKIVSRRIKEAPRGAMGIRMRRIIGRESGVLVEAVLEGLPAQEFLLPGDRIVGIDDFLIATSEDLTAVVQSKSPGEEIKVEVYRDALDARGEKVLGADGRVKQELLTLHFPLGSVEQLDQNGGVSSSARVESARNRMIEILHARFAGRPMRIRTPSVVEADGTYATRSPDSHVSIVWLKRRLELQEIGLAEFDIDTRREATRRLTELMVDAQDTQRTPAEREWLERVLQRYIELVPTD